MIINFRGYRTEDFIKIRDLLMASFEESGYLGNWLIDRWNFCRMVSHTMHGTFDTWEKTVGVWEDEAGRIVGVVNSEGEERGEAFFQLRFPLSSVLLEEMFVYAERTLTVQDKDLRFIRLRIPADDSIRESIAQARGYRKLEWDDSMSVLSLHNLNQVLLPQGYRIHSGPDVTSEAKAVAHAKAFGYFEEDHDRTFPLAFQRMKSAPDYRPDLDLSVIDESGEVVSFCTLWYDDQNQYGVLEPVGTISSARMKGLGRAVITEGLHRLAGYGAKSAYVGSAMDFYKRLGFEVAFRNHIWEKTFTD